MDTKALRQKILDLAIRGKLVPQDPNDEPASVLLERICAEKQQMVKDGKLKAKDIKNDTVIFKGEDNLHYEKFADGTVKCIEDEIPFELPERWEWCRLINICSKLIDGDHNPPKGEDTVTQYLMLSSTNINNDTLVELEKVRYLSKDIFDKENQRTDVNIGDIFFTSVGSIGRSCVYTGGFNICFQRSVSVIRTFILNEYLKRYLDAPFIQNKIAREATGTAQKGFYLNQLSNCLIAVPPINEQQKIANAVNKLMEYIVSIETDKTTLQDLIKQTKSKILDLAIRGKLVPQDPNDEPASVLLECIRTEKEELIKQGKIKRDKKESVIFKGEDNSYYLKIGNLTETLDDWRIDDIPDSWGVCCLGEVCDYGNCTNVDTKDIPETAWILDLEDIEKDTGKVLQKLTLKERNSASTKHSFHKGQVLYSKLRPYLNKVVLADDEGYCTSEILPLDFNDMVYPKYARYYLMSPTFLKYANYCSYGVKMPRLGTNDGKKAILTVPPLQEQHRIVNAIETIFAKLDEIANALS